ncbi:MAG: hypothetical protein Q8L55_15360 [Phycisphaerales bacterium]|nr:hypothetical protein [Phycisphaerales bacterium]
MSSDPTDQNVPHSANAQEALDAEAARFLASLQQRLSQVQSTTTELKGREAALAEQARALDVRRAEIEQSERVIGSTQNQLAARAANLDDREAAVARAAAQTQELRTQIERAEAESAAERARLIEEARDAQQRIETGAQAKAQEIVSAAESLRASIEHERAEAEKLVLEAQARLDTACAQERTLDEQEKSLAREAAACAARLNQAEEASAALAAREERLRHGERVLADREKATTAIAELAARRAAEHTAAVAAIEQRSEQVQRAELAVRAAGEESQARRQAEAQSKGELDRRETAILSREQQLRAAQDELERRRVFVSQCEAQASQLEATSRHLREQAEQVKSASERQAAQWQDRATEAQFQAESALQQVQKLQEQLTAAQSRASALEEEMDQVKVLGINISPEAQGRVEGLTRRAEAAEQRAATLQEIIDQNSDEVAKAEARYDTLARQLDEAQQAMAFTADSHAGQLAALQARADEHAALLAASQAAAQQAMADAEHAALELADQAARTAQATERAESLVGRVTAAEQAASEADARAEQLKASAAAQPQASHESRQRTDELEAKLAKSGVLIAELQAKVSVAQAEASAGAGEGFPADQRRRLEAELAQREEALSVLANRLLNSEERAVAMQSQLDRLSDELTAWEERAVDSAFNRTDSNGAVHHPTAEVAASDTRRRRLRRVRDLLGQEHRKVLLAKEALGRHKAEADAVLQQRARLSQIAQSLQVAEAEANKTRAKSAAGSIIVAAMMTLVTVSGLSYLAAGVLWPSTYAARATLAAESDGRSPTEQQNRIWVSAHERLATDLQVYTLAAEKFQQRGMRELSTPAAVQDRFGNALALLTDVPGQVTLELRGVGREGTARELETFAGAVSAIANSRRQMRQDGLGTAVVKQAEAGSEALDTKRQTAMSVALVTGLLASAAVGFGIYAVFTRSHRPKPGADPLDGFGNQPLARLAPNHINSAAA